MRAISGGNPDWGKHCRSAVIDCSGESVCAAMCLLLYLASLKLALRRLAWLHTVCPLDTLPSVSKSPERRAILQQQCQQSSSTIGGSSSESSGSRSTITSPPEHTPVCPSARSSSVPQLLPSPPLSSLVLTMDSTGLCCYCCPDLLFGARARLSK